MSQRDLLIEIGTEELPPKALRQLSHAFRDSVAQQLADESLHHRGIKAMASPRRLALLISDLDEHAPAKAIEQWGPPANVAFDNDGNPTRAAQAFAEKNGIELAALPDHIANDGKQDKLCYRSEMPGSATAVIVGKLIEVALTALPISKRMRWGSSRAEFVRPVHWLLCLFGEETLHFDNILGLRSGNTTRGHRFHSDGEFRIPRPADYERLLETQGKVIVDFQRRQDMIRQQVAAAGAALGGTAVIDDDLLNEVTALVEWPVALAGSFERRFLEVPAEALISSMKEHQKYFHVRNKNGELMPYFITVSNIESREPQKVIDGNERVIRPRLSDAAFFFETDCKSSLMAQREKLHNIVFQDKLGTLFDKTQRVAVLAEILASQLGCDANKARRAAELSKSDLVTEMVGEFDDMQGIAGYYYARNDGEDEAIATAMNEQYMPRFASDQLPEGELGTVLALADRLDTITGIFGIGQIPTGSKDPFALRRASLGVLRIIIEKQLPLDLRPLLAQAIAQHSQVDKNDPALLDTVTHYILERLRAWYEDRGIAAEVFMAVNAKGLTAPLDIDRRVTAVQGFAQLPEAAALAAANKRVSNILAKAEGDVAGAPDASLLVEKAEQSLAAELGILAEEVEPLFAQQQYEAALTALARLRQPVDDFFDQVMVNVDDGALKNNRLALLKQLQDLFLRAADISLLATSKG